MKNNRNIRLARLFALTVAMLFLLSFVADSAFARGGFRGGGFRTSSFRSFGSRRSSSSLFSWGSSRPRTSTGLGRSGVSGSRSAIARERNLYSAARRNGTVYATRTEATQAFRTKYASRYTSRFASRPATRPSYIPQTTTVNGRTMNVVYNSRYGGYGYMDPFLGHWVMYNALADTAMLGALMSQQGYWYGAPPVYVSHGAGFFTWAIILFIAFLIISSVMRNFRSRGR